MNETNRAILKFDNLAKRYIFSQILICIGTYLIDFKDNIFINGLYNSILLIVQICYDWRMSDGFQPLDGPQSNADLSLEERDESCD